MGPQGTLQESRKSSAKKPPRNNKEAARKLTSTKICIREKQARHRSNQCPRQATITGTVHFTSVFWAGTVVFERQLRQRCLIARIKTKRTRFPSQHVLDTCEAFASKPRECLNQDRRMHFQTTLTQLRWVHPMLLVIAALTTEEEPSDPRSLDTCLRILHVPQAIFIRLVQRNQNVVWSIWPQRDAHQLLERCLT